MFVNIVMSEVFVGKGCGVMSEHQEVIQATGDSGQSIAIKACNPDISIVIEACAGSGKTWILISRIFRLLLSGIAPHEILAITFTRKAAQEMRDRLEKILIDFTKFDDHQIRKELLNRGIQESDVDANIPCARALFEKVLSNPQEISIDTFHGWFSKISQAAPLTSDINTQGVVREDQARMMNEAMEVWWEKLGKGEGEFAELKSKYLELFDQLSPSQLNSLIVGKSSLVQQKAMWDLFEKHCFDQDSSVLEVIESQFPLASKINPLIDILDDKKFDWSGLQIAAEYLVNGGIKDQGYRDQILYILARKDSNSDSAELIHLLNNLFFTEKQTVRNDFTKVSNPVKKFLNENQLPHLIDEIVQTYKNWIAPLEDYDLWRIETDLLRININWLDLAKSAADHYIRFKKNSRVLDFSDFEYNAFRLMSDDKTATYLQERLDAKYKHILVDEFQDTNPLQWQILKSWLDGYQGATQKPIIFLVGDPKQSIYRFRRADARLFNEAKTYLHKNFDAIPFDHSETRRNPPDLIQLVNNLFIKIKEEISDYPFEKHTTLWKNPSEQQIKTKVFRLPLIERTELPSENDSRNPFDTPMIDRNLKIDSIQSEDEAMQIGQLILHWCETEWVITDTKEGAQPRRPNFGDFLILIRVKKHLQVIEKVFNQLGIPCDTPRTGGLLQSLEADDILALLKTLLIPANNLTLAHVLRSPIFSCSEQDLEELAIHAKTYRQNWWAALHVVANENLKNAFSKLNTWKDLAKFLPVHDLLDRIYHEGNILKVYASASPSLMRTKILANLEAFLLLALNTNAGRYPSLSRFIDELEILAKGDLQESPDEGEMQEDATDQDEDLPNSSVEDSRFVRVMTIHSAKGLEAPFVFLTNANTSKQKKDSSSVLFDWPLGQNAPQGLSIYNSKLPSEYVKKLLAEEEKIALKENWNLLYVAMTRAKQCLVVSGLGKKKTSNNPSLINDESWYAYLMAAGLAEINSEELMSLDINSYSESKVMLKTTTTIIEEVNASFPILPSMPAVILKDQSEQEDQEDEGTKLVTNDNSTSFAQELGTAIHLILERHLNDVDRRKAFEVLPEVSVLQHWLNIDAKLMNGAFNAAQTILSQPHLLNYFDPSKYLNAWNELDLIDENSNLLKVDRLVELNEKLVILDYKLNIPAPGTDALSKYENQIKKYAAIIRRLRSDKVVEGYLVDQHGDIYQINTDSLVVE
jgi:ATP-dependent helicase/nuclease subunit A